MRFKNPFLRLINFYLYLSKSKETICMWLHKMKLLIRSVITPNVSIKYDCLR